jgi:hypothetical protein
MPITTLRICNEGYPSIVVLITFPEDEARRKYHHWRSVNNMLNKKYRRQPTENKYKLSNKVEYFHIFFGQSNGQTISFNVQSKTQQSTILANRHISACILFCVRACIFIWAGLARLTTGWLASGEISPRILFLYVFEINGQKRLVL